MLAIIADDLTGALDSAAPFAARGLAVEVALAGDAIAEAVDSDPDVISINLGSREGTPAAAQAAMRVALDALGPDVTLFKKVDSRLKGHIAAELDATPYRSILMAPAIPDFGRIVRNGHVEGFGIASSIDIAGALGRHAAHALIPDVVNQSDFDMVLREAARDGADLFVGARGLAEALAIVIAGDVAPQFADVPPGPALFVIGSRDPITVDQIERLRAAADVDYHPAPNGCLPEGAGREKAMLTVVQATAGEGDVSSAAVSHALATSVVPQLTERASTLLVSGGATAEVVLDALGIRRFRLLGECLPGLGLAHADGRCIIAKSGGFGEPDTLRRIAAKVLSGEGLRDGS